MAKEKEEKKKGKGEEAKPEGKDGKDGKKGKGKPEAAEAAAEPKAEGKPEGEAKPKKEKKPKPEAAAGEAKAGEGSPAGAPADGTPAAAAAPSGETKDKKSYRRIRHKPSKRFRKDFETVAGKAGEGLALKAAVTLLKQTKALKFDQTVEVVLVLGIDPKQADQLVRGSISLPHGIGKSKKVIVFCSDDQAEKAKAAGALDAGLDALVKKVNDGWTDFDVAVATPDVMGKIARLGRVLGPQGKMPNPKSGTVTADVATAVKEHSAGKIQFRNDAGGNVHAIVGKLSFDEKKLVDNITSFVEHIRRIKPAAAKGHYLKRAVLSATMSPSVPLNLSGVGGEDAESAG